MISALIEDYAGPQAARRKLAEIAEFTERLRMLPHIGAQRDHILPRIARHSGSVPRDDHLYRR